MNYCSFDKLDYIVYDAVANFNDGRQGSIDVLQKMIIWEITTTMCFELNKRRRYLAKYKSKDSTKKTRKIIRAEKNIAAKQRKSESTVYNPGGF